MTSQQAPRGVPARPRRASPRPSRPRAGAPARPPLSQRRQRQVLGMTLAAPAVIMIAVFFPGAVGPDVLHVADQLVAAGSAHLGRVGTDYTGRSATRISVTRSCSRWSTRR